MSWPAARKVLAPVAAATLLGDADGTAPADDEAEDGTEAGADAGALEGRDDVAAGEPAGALAETAAGELADELQADASKAKPASTTPALSCRALRELTVDMKFHSSTFFNGSASQVNVYDAGHAPAVGVI